MLFWGKKYRFWSILVDTLVDFGQVCWILDRTPENNLKKLGNNTNPKKVRGG